MNEMTDEQINQAVAECCGWKDVQSPTHPEYRRLLNPRGECVCSSEEITPRHWSFYTPRYTESRDAMAGALEKLDDNRNLLDESQGHQTELDKFIEELERIIEPTCAEEHTYFKCITATPKQLAIAFLKAKGKL